jgi:hypothetical protein
MSSYFNRYTQFTSNDTAITVPYVHLPEKISDIFVVYNQGKSRLDKISDDKYGTPYFGWLIMLANPEYGGLEWNIPDNAAIRVPYPLDASMADYKAAMKLKLAYYGE